MKKIKGKSRKGAVDGTIDPSNDSELNARQRGPQRGSSDDTVIIPDHQLTPFPVSEDEGEPSGEMYSVINGKREDAHVHEDILAAGDHEAALSVGRQVARDLGLSEAAIKILYATDGEAATTDKKGDLSERRAPARTSLSHPIQIAAVSGGPGLGRVGITLCPGKYDPHAMSGVWERDLGRDIDVIRDWGAAAVVTLVEPAELILLRVEQLGDAVARRQMSWFHLPIVDVSTPDDAFERAWVLAGEGLRSILRSGFDVLVHCRGGLGRAGLIGARLLIELGMEPEKAIANVRAVRPGAIETSAQEKFVRKLQTLPERSPAITVEATRDRAIGALLGLAVGDAVGTTLEFKRRDSYEPLRDMVGGGPFRLKPGEWTDDTSMALCLADSLIETNGQFDAADLMRRFVRWRDKGENSANDRGCFDIGITTTEALNRWLRDKDPYAGSADPQSAGNGSLMRLAPVSIRFWNNKDKRSDVAKRQSKTTHAAPETVDACAVYADIVADAIAGQRRSQVLTARTGPYAGKIQEIASGSWGRKTRGQIGSSGYVAHSLEAALWCIASTADFQSAILKAANLGEDSDTTAAVAGQLAGALYGASAIPQAWLDKLAKRDWIQERAAALFAQSLERHSARG